MSRGLISEDAGAATFGEYASGEMVVTAPNPSVCSFGEYAAGELQAPFGQVLSPPRVSVSARGSSIGDGSGSILQIAGARSSGDGSDGADAAAGGSGGGGSCRGGGGGGDGSGSSSGRTRGLSKAVAGSEGYIPIGDTGACDGGSVAATANVVADEFKRLSGTDPAVFGSYASGDILSPTEGSNAFKWFGEYRSDPTVTSAARGKLACTFGGYAAGEMRTRGGDLSGGVLRVGTSSPDEMLQGKGSSSIALSSAASALASSSAAGAPASSSAAGAPASSGAAGALVAEQSAIEASASWPPATMPTLAQDCMSDDAFAAAFGEYDDDDGVDTGDVTRRGDRSSSNLLGFGSNSDGYDSDTADTTANSDARASSRKGGTENVVAISSVAHVAVDQFGDLSSPYHAPQVQKLPQLTHTREQHNEPNSMHQAKSRLHENAALQTHAPTDGCGGGGARVASGAPSSNSNCGSGRSGSSRRGGTHVGDGDRISSSDDTIFMEHGNVSLLAQKPTLDFDDDDDVGGVDDVWDNAPLHDGWADYSASEGPTSPLEGLNAAQLMVVIETQLGTATSALATKMKEWKGHSNTTPDGTITTSKRPTIANSVKGSSTKSPHNCDGDVFGSGSIIDSAAKLGQSPSEEVALLRAEIAQLKQNALKLLPIVPSRAINPAMGTTDDTLPRLRRPVTSPVTHLPLFLTRRAHGDSFCLFVCALLRTCVLLRRWSLTRSVSIAACINSIAIGWSQRFSACRR
jgi:hypothetical protein